MSLRTVLGGVGAVVGFIYGGPQGAQWGWAIGSAVGGLVDPQVIKGPKLGEIPTQGQQEGLPRPIVYGASPPMAGCVIAQAPPRKETVKSSGKGGPKYKTQKVYRTYAIGVCEGPITGFTRVWRNGKKVYDAIDEDFTVESVKTTIKAAFVRINPTVIVSKNALFLQQARFFLGDYDQEPSPDLEAVFGVGTTAAHRGTAYMVMVDEDCTDIGGAIPQWTFQLNGVSSQEVSVGTIDINAVTEGASSAAGGVSAGVNVAGLLTTDTLIIRRNPAGLYTAWSPWGVPAYSGSHTGSVAHYRILRGGVAAGDVLVNTSGGPFNGYAAAAAAYDAQHPTYELTGYTNYTFYFLDNPVADNTGGMSFTLTKRVNADATITLPDMVEAILQRAGIPADRYDISTLNGQTGVPGLIITNTYQAGQALQALGEIYLFDTVYYDGKIRFRYRGEDSVATITEDDMLDDDEDIEEDRSEVSRGDPIGVPRLLNLLYHDEAATGLDDGKQTSERAGDRRAVGESTLQTPVMISATVAARAVDVAHKALIERLKGSVKFSLPEKWAWLVPTDPIVVQWEGRSERVVIARVEQCDGYQRYECSRDRQSAYTSNIEAIPLPADTGDANSLPGPTVLLPLDVPLLLDTDDPTGLGILIAVAGLEEGWSGCTVEVSYDNGQNYSDVLATAFAATIGYLSSPLGNHPPEYPDVQNTLSLTMASFGKELTGTDLAGMLNRTNLAAVGTPETGWELINFADVEALSDEVFELSYLLRGRKGSTARHHVEGEFFVLLDRNVLEYTPMQLTDLNRTLTYRATSDGTTTDDATVLSVVYAGLSQTERAVSLLQARREGANIVATWLGVGRLGGGTVAQQGQRFEGFRVTMSDGVTTLSNDTTLETLTVDVSTLSGPVTISVAQLNSMTGAGPAIEVILQ